MQASSCHLGIIKIVSFWFIFKIEIRWVQFHSFLFVNLHCKSLLMNAKPKTSSMLHIKSMFDETVPTHMAIWAAFRWKVIRICLVTIVHTRMVSHKWVHASRVMLEQGDRPCPLRIPLRHWNYLLLFYHSGHDSGNDSGPTLVSTGTSPPWDWFSPRAYALGLNQSQGGLVPVETKVGPESFPESCPEW